jgi:hypothetical protein
MPNRTLEVHSLAQIMAWSSMLRVILKHLFREKMVVTEPERLIVALLDLAAKYTLGW